MENGRNPEGSVLRNPSFNNLSSYIKMPTCEQLYMYAVLQATRSEITIIFRVFCPRAGLSLQIQAPRLQFCPKAGLPPQTQEPRLQFY